MFWEFQGAIVSQIDTLLDNESVTLNDLLEEDDILQECKASNQKLLNFLTKPEVLEELIVLATTEPAPSIRSAQPNCVTAVSSESQANDGSPALQTGVAEESDEKTRYAKANIACELLTSDVSPITDALIRNNSLLSKLYTFIESEKQLNPLLASFFSKTMSLLLVKRSDSIFEFLKVKEEFISHMLNHIETSAIMDFLLKLITGTDNIALRAAISKWLQEKKLIGKLISIFGGEFSAEAQTNAAQLLCDIIKAIRDHQSSLQDQAEPDVLLQDIESTATVSELLNEIFNTRSESSIVSGICVLQSLLEYKRHCANIQQQIQHHSTVQLQGNIQAQNEDFEGVPIASNPIFSRMELAGSDQMTALDAERLSKCVRQVHAGIIPRLQDFHFVLLNPPERPPIHTTVGVIDIPLGATRLEVVHLIRALLSSNNPEVNQKISELKTVPVLIDLFFSYPWNNFLHTQVEQSIKSILNNAKSNSPVTSPTVNDDISTPPTQLVTFQLVEQLFSDSHLLERIVNAWEVCHNEATTKQPRPGYMGHIIKIANHIVSSKDQEAVIQASKCISEEYQQKWNVFVEKTLSDINKRMQTPLVNEVPNSATFDKNAIRQQENALQQAFIEYQMQQMTRSLCTQIEFSATEFNDIDDNIQPQVDHLSRVNFNLENQLHDSSRNVDIFEQMCSERVRTSLDSNSSDEEDLWESADKELSFTRSSVTETRNQAPQLEFGNDGSGFSKWNEFIGNSADVPDVQMDIDQTEVRSGGISSPPNNATVTGTAAVADPWTVAKESNSSENLVSDSSWADFSNFDDLHSSRAPPPNMCISVSSMMPSSADTFFAASEGTENTQDTENSKGTEKSKDVEVDCEVSNVVEEKDSEVSSTIDNVLNGPH